MAIQGWNSYLDCIWIDLTCDRTAKASDSDLQVVVTRKPLLQDWTLDKLPPGQTGLAKHCFRLGTTCRMLGSTQVASESV